jgi:hypothetical protein
MFKYILVISILFNNSLLFAKGKDSEIGKNQIDSQNKEKQSKSDNDKNHDKNKENYDEFNKDKEDDPYYWIYKGWDEMHPPM